MARSAFGNGWLREIRRAEFELRAKPCFPQEFHAGFGGLAFF
jgi:hypothetical protein